MRTNPKVLIVDDQQVNRATVKLSLKNEGYDFFEASNGIEAIEKAIEVQPDVILMDAIMPIMDGFEATKKIREVEQIQRVPILMITSLDQKEDKIKALEAGVNDFISKPIDKVELKARCKSYAEISRLNDRYTLATKNSTTNLPNKLALLKDITKTQEIQELFLIKIDNYNTNENFYGSDIVQNLDISFSKSINKYKNDIGDFTLYHISSGKYALLINQGLELSKSLVEKFCNNFISNVKKENFSYKEFNFDVNITMSFSTSSSTLYEDANAILSEAIHQKKDFLLSFDVIDQIKSSLKENLHMLRTIKIALKNDKILPFFQPIYNMETKEINRYEALVRMFDEERNIIPPGPYFLDVAKKGKLYSEVTKVLFKKVIAKIRKHGCEISVNLSSIDIEDHSMSEYILNLLEDNRDITDKLIFELLEDKETQDYQYVNNFIKLSRAFGVKIAIDDFGSGYSNFIRIIEFKPDIIKIDGSLVEDIAHSESNRKTVKAIKIFADSIGAKTVAEYVTNKITYEIIDEIGIDYAQGFHIGKPLLNLIDEKELETA